MTQPARTPDPAAEVRDLVVELPDRERPYASPLAALRGLSLTAPAGQVTALVGANGAGKTTALRALIGAQPWTQGSVALHGSEMGAADVPLPVGVAHVPDAPSYPRSWTARHLLQQLERVGRPVDGARFAARLDAHRVPGRRPARTLSRGQLTQLALTAALAQDPQVLLLDEPFARLDPLARSELLDELRALMAHEGRSILLSTHDLEGMDRFVDHLVVIADGQTVLEGEAEALREEFLLLETAADAPLAQDTAMRLIGAVTTGGSRRALVAVEEAVGLAPDADLRRPELPELITHWLRGARRAKEAA
ncbi:ATP-binding cassette domain-containing protein [Brachybacterium sp. AOP43-C2-M15]|uniref:ATP-binding cassette domain-containing protein n=1 Tax=Brachybacterium sp. AOP43-C2-M15 TaxID=3457661 RepID=UPI004033939A